MPSRFTLAIIIAAIVGIVVIGGAYMSALTGTPKGADASNAEVVAEGKAIYTESCASCHGEKLEGQPNWRQKNPDGTLPAPPHNETGHTWHHADNLLFEITRNGGASVAPAGFKSAMPEFKGILSDDKIWAVLSYIKSTWPKEIRSRQERMSKQRG